MMLFYARRMEPKLSLRMSWYNFVHMDSTDMFLILLICQLIVLVKHVEAGYSYDASTDTYTNSNDPNQTAIPINIPLTAISVDLSGNSIVTCTGFPTLPELTSLGLQNNELNEFPDLRPVAATLISLDLTQNDIAFFPAEFMSFSKLQTLNLDSNNVVQFPDMTQMLALESLSLYDNHIQAVPGELLSPLINLVNIDLKKNDLSTFPDVYLPRLTHLRLQRNPDVTTLPVWSSLGRTITYITVGYTNIKSISLQALLELPSLTQFKLKHASVSEIAGELFIVLRDLETLDLTGNNLKWIPDVCDAGPTNVAVRLVYLYTYM